MSNKDDFQDSYLIFQNLHTVKFDTAEPGLPVLLIQLLFYEYDEYDDAHKFFLRTIYYIFYY